MLKSLVTTSTHSQGAVSFASFLLVVSGTQCSVIFLFSFFQEVNGHVCVICPWHKYNISLQTGEGMYQVGSPYKISLQTGEGMYQVGSPYKISLQTGEGMYQVGSPYKISLQTGEGMYQVGSPYKISLQTGEGMYQVG